MEHAPEPTLSADIRHKVAVYLYENQQTLPQFEHDIKLNPKQQYDCIARRIPSLSHFIRDTNKSIRHAIHRDTFAREHHLLVLPVWLPFFTILL